MHKKQQSGFGHIELFVVLLVLAVAGFAGWKVLEHHKLPYAKSNTSTTTSAPGLADKFGTLSYAGDLSSKLTTQTVSMTGKGSQGIAIDPKTGWVHLAE